MKLQTCRNDLSYTNAPYCAQQLPRFLIFIEKINFKIKPSPNDFGRIIAGQGKHESDASKEYKCQFLVTT